MWNVNKKKCKHTSTAYIEVLKHTIVSTHHPIKNSRFQKIRDFEYSRTKEIKVPALKCLDCGEIIKTNHQNVASTATTHNYGSCLTNNASMAIGYHSTALGNTSMAIGVNSCVVNTDKDVFKYNGDHSKRSLTNRNIIDMGFIDNLSQYVKEAEKNQEKAIMNYNDKQHKLDRINEKIDALKNKVTGGSNINSLTSEIDRIKIEYDNIVNRQQAIQEAAKGKYVNNNFVSNSIRETANTLGIIGSKLNFPPPPPPRPQGRTIGGDNQTSYYREKQPTPINGIEYIKVMFTGVEVEEKTFNDVKYLDFTFYKPVDQEDSKLKILENGDVIKWEQIGNLFNKTKAIKAIRISEEDLEKARKEL